MTKPEDIDINSYNAGFKDALLLKEIEEEELIKARFLRIVKALMNGDHNETKNSLL